jgi:diaminohydroxyphosphoribosylaminopyrimidine deaminase/5-amino-6-(5-phosphoribosylamino)uracil reductase
MREALHEAEKGRGRTHPNPVVGAVIVRNGRIIARGHHEKAGLPHAEVNALRKAGSKARGAELYVTLEPCNHVGRTPPCTEAILAAGIKKVFFGSVDPNPGVRGHGAQRLRREGVETIGGLLRVECDASNEAWFKFITRGLPWVMLKAAITLDGKLAGGPQPISGKESHALVHQWRDQLDAILVGAGTARADDPLLTARPGRNPLRVVLGDIPRNARMLREKGETISEKGPLKKILQRLAKRGITSVLVEGGANVHEQFLRSGLWDELRLFIAPNVIGAKALDWAGRAEPSRAELRSIAQLGPDVLLTLRNPTSASARRRGARARAE